MTQTMSATYTLRVHPTRSVRRTSGSVLVSHPNETGPDAAIESVVPMTAYYWGLSGC